MDNELFEQCKQVWKATDWDENLDWLLRVNVGLPSEYIRRFPIEEQDDISLEEYADYAVPLYTSDYLLEKLPPSIKGNYKSLIHTGNKFWLAMYGTSTTAKKSGYFGESDSPLKALLKLTIALHQAKELV